MRQLTLPVHLMSIIFLLSIFYACDPDTCKNVICGEFGGCDDAECICEDGYVKDESGLCNLRFRDLVMGDWYNEDTCDSLGIVSDSLVVEANAGDVHKINIIGWRSISDIVVANVTEYHYIIDRQSPSNNDIFIEGTGIYDPEADLLTWSYVIKDETNLPTILIDSCTAIWTR